MATILKCNTVDIKVAEIFALAQPDAIWLCMEHGSLDYNQAENQSNAAKIYDVDSLLRVNRGSYSNYIRGLEVDCTGLIIPQIKSLADLLEKVERKNTVGIPNALTAKVLTVNTGYPSEGLPLSATIAVSSQTCWF